MRQAFRRSPAVVYALAIVCALTFGASQAFGRFAQSTCPYDGYTYLGACVEPGWNTECTQRCQDISHDPGTRGTCDMGSLPGCCVCMMR